jgi:hypothetical protein
VTTPTNGVSVGANLCKEIKKVLKSLDIPTHKLAELVTNGAPSTARENSGVSSLVTNGGLFDNMPLHDT